MYQKFRNYVVKQRLLLKFMLHTLSIAFAAGLGISTWLALALKPISTAGLVYGLLLMTFFVISIASSVIGLKDGGL